MQHPGPGSLERNFGGLPPSHLQPGAPGLTAPGFAPHKKPFSEGFYNSGFEGATYGDIRLHDPSIVSTSPGKSSRSPSLLLSLPNYLSSPGSFLPSPLQTLLPL